MRTEHARNEINLSSAMHACRRNADTFYQKSSCSPHAGKPLYLFTCAEELLTALGQAGIEPHHLGGVVEEREAGAGANGASKEEVPEGL